MGYTLDARGKPVYNDTADPLPDFQAASDWADKVGGMLKGTNAQRIALTPSQSSPGWTFYETDTGNMYVRNAAGSWLLVFSESGWVTSGFFDPESGWTPNTTRVRRNGGSVSLYISFTRNGSSIGVPSDGNVANQLIGTVSSLYRPTGDQPLTSGAQGRPSTGYINSAGQVLLAGTITDITDGTALSLGNTYLI